MYFLIRNMMFMSCISINNFKMILACLLLQGNVVLCGLRNGAIVTVDVRENQERCSSRLIRHRIPFSHLHARGQNSSKQWFEVSNSFRIITYAPTTSHTKLWLQNFIDWKRGCYKFPKYISFMASMFSHCLWKAWSADFKFIL